MIDVDLTIRGLQELQQENIRRIAALQPNTGLGRATQFVTAAAHRFLTTIVHVDTGAYRAANLMEVNGNRGRIYVSPSAINPRSRQLVRDYAPEEEARGGGHAAYKRTEEIIPGIQERAIRELQKELKL